MSLRRRARRAFALALFAVASSAFCARAASAQQAPPSEPLLLTFVAVQDEALVDFNEPAVWVASGIPSLCDGAIAKDEATLEDQTHAQSPLGQQTLAPAQDVVAHCQDRSDDYAQTEAAAANVVAGWDLYRAGKFADALAAFARANTQSVAIWRGELAGRDTGLRNMRASAALVRVDGDGLPPASGVPAFTRSQYFGFLAEAALVAAYAQHWTDLCKQHLGPSAPATPAPKPH